MSDARAPDLWRDGDFLRLWTGQTVSEMGSVVTRTALPILAVLTLHVGPLEIGVLVASASVAVLLVGLFAGVFVDRLPRRPFMIGADAARALLLLSIPVAAFAGRLGMEQLYLVAFLEAGLGSFFEIAYHSYVPGLVAPDRLLEANAKMGMTSAVAELGGPGIGGALVQLVSAPVAILVDAVSYVVSAVSIALIRAPERAVAPVDVPRDLWGELAEGLKAVGRHPLLRPLALASVTSALFGNFFAALYTLYALEELHLSPLLLGVVISAGGVGSLAATGLVRPLTLRFGVGPTLVWTRVAAGVLAFLVPLAGGPPWVAALFLFIPQLFGDGLATVSQINGITLRQVVTPARLLGRVNGTSHVLLEGIAPIGAIAGALIAESFGIRTAVVVAVVGSFAGLAFLVWSPVRTLRAAAATAA
ncbi:MAG TPA: MFS transporter [Candidatus Saccharimonadales bacterium]|nr:MFS transporter [Candidatus Saccharimonadales bacterium]